jgi:hypothetical protein
MAPSLSVGTEASLDSLGRSASGIFFTLASSTLLLVL